MKLHANAALSLTQRRRMVLRVIEQGWTIKAAAAAAETSPKNVWEVGGSLPRLAESSVCWIAAALRAWSPIAPTSGGSRRSPRCGGCGSRARRSPSCSAMPLSTVSGILTRIGMGRLGRLGLEPAERYERERPGELIHIDVKKLGRIQGGAGKRVRDRLRQHYNPRPHRRARQAPQHGRLGLRAHRDRRLHPPGLRRGACATRRPAPRSRFLRPRDRLLPPPRDHRRARDDRQRQRLPLRRSTRSPAARSASGTSAPAPRRPQTNGKAERFIRTMLAGWAYGAIYGHSRERTAALDGWLWTYNHHRRHSAIGRQPPITRLNNLLGSYT